MDNLISLKLGNTKYKFFLTFYKSEKGRTFLYTFIFNLICVFIHK